MLNEVSCWYVDWGTLGTWVGGMGAAAAAFAAVWTVRHGSERRESYSRFLLEQDLDRLDSASESLKIMSDWLGMASYEHHETAERVDWDKPYEDAKQRYKNLIREFEYFGNSEQQFVYRPPVAELGKVHVLMRGLNDQLDTIYGLGYHIDEDAAATEAREGAERIRSAVDALRAKLGIAKVVATSATT